MSAPILHPLVLTPNVIATFTEGGQVLKAPPKLKVTAWAEQYRVLSTESSNAAGRYRSTLAPYQREMQDAVNIPGVEKITYFTAGQIGKSLCLENIFAYFCKEDPCPMIFMWPTELIAKAWSVDTLEPLIRDTPEMAKLFASGTRKSNNAVLFKKFPGGSLSVIGANSAAGLRRRRARIVFCEEIDAYKASAGDEGDPRELVAKRQETFWNAIMLEASTCTMAGMSAIEASYEDSNKQRYWVPCPHCSEVKLENGCISGPETQRNIDAGIHLDGYQVLHWNKKEDVLGGMILDKVPPHTGTQYECAHCGVLIDEYNKAWMLKYGEWRAERPERVTHQGFHLSTLYSPFPKARWSYLAGTFLKATHHRENRELLKAFVNMTLAETWKDEGFEIDEDELLRRVEDYPPPALPNKVTVLTAGVDVQDDRFEVVVKGWGKGQESWCVDWHRIDGDTAKQESWQKLDKFLTETKYLHANGVRMDIASAFIDSGHRAGNVFAYTKNTWERRICACRGYPGFNRPPVGAWNKSNQQRQKVYPVHVDVLKELVYGRLRLDSPGPGYMHFSRAKNDLEYFKQLKSEKLKPGYKKGFPVREWILPPGVRNEALDCEVYATAAFLSLAKDVDAMLEFLREQLIDEAKKLAEQRREKYDPNQLALIETSPIHADRPAVPAAEQPSSAVIPPPPIPENGEGVSEEEYKVAANDKPEPEEKEVEEPVVRVRRSSWVTRY